MGERVEENKRSKPSREESGTGSNNNYSDNSEVKKNSATSGNDAPSGEAEHSERGQEGQNFLSEEPISTEKAVLVGSLLFVLFLALISAVQTDSAVFYPIIGFSPLMLSIITMLLIIDRGFKGFVFWSLPFLYSLLFFIVGGIEFLGLDKQMDIPSLTSINIFLGIFLLAGLSLLEFKEFLKVSSEASEEDFDLEESIDSVEDRCKAMNFAIGRVYSKYHGGTEKMRKRIKIPKDLYNEFNEISEENFEENKEEALVLIKKIRKRLSLLTKKEKEIFGEQWKELEDLERDEGGESKVLEVLKRNDKDPVDVYYLALTKSTEKIMKELRKL